VENGAAYKTVLEEYASPAFIKRARVSYGSLFEGGLDIFEEDGSVKGKGRKRTRFGRPSGAWRYTSQSPSPEPEGPEAEAMNGAVPNNAAVASSPAGPPQMLDEGVQTVEFETRPGPLPTALDIGPSDRPLESTPILSSMEGIPPLSTEIPTQTAPPAEGLTKSATPFGPSLFGSYTPNTEAFGAPLFPTATSAASFGASEIQMPLGDQVRFGFAGPPVSPFTPQAPKAIAQLYPEVLLEQPIHLAPAPTADSAQPSQEPSAPTGNRLEEPLPMPAVEPQIYTQLPVWPISSETLDAKDVEAHVPAEAALQSGGPSSIGDNDVSLSAAIPSDIPREVDDYGYNNRRYQNEAEEAMVGMEEGLPEEYNDGQYEDDDGVEDEEAEFDEEEANQAGDDYDMRNYTDVDDDQEGFEGYDDQQMDTHDGAQVFDDGEVSYDEGDEEDESDYDEDEEPEPAAPSLRPATSAAPVVIDLISDSEDEEPAAPPQQHVQQPSIYYPVLPPANVANLGWGPSGAKPEPSPPAGLANQLSQQPLSEERADASDFGSADGQFAPHGGDATMQLDEGSPSYGIASEESGEDDAEDVAQHSQSEKSDVEAEGSIDNGPETPFKGLSEEIQSDDEMADDVAPSNPLEDEDETDGAFQSELLDTGKTTTLFFSQTTSVVGISSQAVRESYGQGEDGNLAQTATAGEKILAKFAVEDKLTETPTREVREKESSYRREAAPSSPPLSQPLASQERQYQGSVPSSPIAPQILPKGLSTQLPTPFATQPSELSELAETALYGFEAEAETHREVDGEAESDEEDVEIGAESSKEGPQSLGHSDNIQEADITEAVTVLASGALPQAPTLIEGPEASERESPKRTPSPKIAGEAVVEADAVDPVDTADEKRDHQTVVRLPPPPSEIKDIEISERLPEVMEVDGEEITVVQLPLAEEAEAEAEDPVNKAREVPVPEPETSTQEGIPSEVAGSDGEAVAREVPLRHNADVRSPPRPSDSKSEIGDDTPKPHETRRATRGRPKKGGTSTKAASKPQPQPEPVADASIELARGSRRGRRGQKQDDAAPLTVTPTTTFRRSPTPEVPDASLQLANASLLPPSKAIKARPEISVLKSELTKGLRTGLSWCLALEKLSHNVGKRGEFVAIATTDSTVPERTKARQFAISFSITDASTGPSTVVETQIYRAHKDSLPTVKAGDGVLLRNFEITALTNRGWGLRSHEESSYVVFGESDNSGPPQIKGPPVEDIDAEKDYVARLKDWYALLDSAKLTSANNKVAAGGATKKK